MLIKYFLKYIFQNKLNICPELLSRDELTEIRRFIIFLITEQSNRHLRMRNEKFFIRFNLHIKQLKGPKIISHLASVEVQKWKNS